MTTSQERPATLDDEVVDMIVDLGGEELLIELAETFRVDTAVRRERLREAIGNGDADVVSSVAHALKSGSASLGAMKLSAVCRELEAAGSSGCLEGAVELMERFDEELDGLETALQARWS